MTQPERITKIRRLGAQAAKRKKALWVVAGIVGASLAIETNYVVRELLAAELIFGLGSILLWVVVAILYLIGVACERGFDRARRACRRACTSLRVHHQLRPRSDTFTEARPATGGGCRRPEWLRNVSHLTS